MDKIENINENQFNYDFVQSVARIACYDDFKSAPRITVIEPATTDEFIMNMTTTTYEQSKMLGGKIPFTIIKEVSENFIHARFKEITISIYDEGNTIRFADQGPGINDKEKVKLPGYSSAIEPMKQYIRGVGSGLPIVKEYFDEKHGSVTIDDNVLSGAVVTISLNHVNDSEENSAAENIPDQMLYYDNTFRPLDAYQNNSLQSVYPRSQQRDYINQQQRVINKANYQNFYAPTPNIPVISEKGKVCLKTLKNGAFGISELNEQTGIPNSSIHYELKKLEDAGLVEMTSGKKRVLTQAAWEIIDYI